MAEGKISEIGSFADCVNASNGRLSIVAQNLNEDEKPDISMEAAVVNSSTSAPVYNECKKESHSQINDDNVPSDGPEDKHDSQLSESKAEGVIGRGTYITYARALGGYLIVVIIVLLFTITQGSTLSSILVMGRWAQRPPNRQKDASFIGLIAGLAFSVLILSITRSLFTFSRTIQASQHLHDDMARAVLRAKVAFFDTNPSGRILNRFSADVGSNDDNLPGILYDFTSTFFLTLGAIVTCIIVLPFILIIIPLLFWYFLRSRNIFVTTSRELKRLEGTARSPIYAMLNESLSGIATIRANNVVSYFQEKFTFLQNIHSRALFAFIAGSRWVGFRMDSIMFINITAACYLAVLFNQQGKKYELYMTW
jgi:ATP-binding cassette subfamily C (CFTR/MRP) protein 4